MIDFLNVRNIVTPKGEVSMISRGAEILFRKQRYKRELLYLESTGTQWIDIGEIINTVTDTVELVFQNTEKNVYKWFFGEHDNNARFALGSGDGVNKRNLAYGSNTYKVTDIQQYDSKHTFIANERGVFVDNTSIARFSSFASTSTLYLFNLNLSSGNYMASAKIWSYKHTRNGVLIRDLIPVIDMDDVPCMYDKVSGKLFYNQGTGEFAYEDLPRLPLEYQEVEYLEGTGSQFIDTRYIPNTNTKVELYAGGINANTFPTTSGSWFVGSRTNYQVEAFGTYYNPSQQQLYGAFGKQQTSVSVSTSVFYGNDHLFVIDKSGLYLDGSKKMSFNTSFSGKYPLWLFTINLAGTSANIMRFKTYYFKICENEVLIRDFVPCYRKSDGKPGMYDLVTETFFTNKGTGEFICGQEVT